MKTPRVSDFDPNTKVATLKSSLDNMPVIEKPKVSNRSPSYAQNISRVVSQSEQQLVRKGIHPSLPLSGVTRRARYAT